MKLRLKALLPAAERGGLWPLVPSALMLITLFAWSPAQAGPRIETPRTSTDIATAITTSSSPRAAVSDGASAAEAAMFSMRPAALHDHDRYRFYRRNDNEPRARLNPPAAGLD